LIEATVRITKLDGLRGIFSLMVVFYHYDEIFLPFDLYNNVIIRESFTFVDFFFVLSGFVISYNYNNIASFNQFILYIKKRFIRLYPLLFYTSTLFLLYELVFNLFFSYLLLTPESIPTLLLAYLDTTMFLNSTPLLGSSNGMNYPTWSISAEMIVYIIFGIIVLKTTKRYRNAVFIIGLIICILISLDLEKYFLTGNYGFIRAYISFIVGYYVWFFSRKNFKISNYWELFFVPLLLLLFYALNSFESTRKEIFGLAIVPLFFGFSILAFIKSDGLISKILESKPFKFLGDISYSVYLNHAIVVILFPRFFFQILSLDLNNFNKTVVLISTIIALVFYSYLTYLFVEKKIGLYLRKKLL
jgi:peptidoglycan/LPS O-acetylase OafA/YrhL